MYLCHWNTGGRRWGLSLWEKKKLLMFSLPLLSHTSLSGCAPHGGAGYKSLRLGSYHFVALLVLGALPVSCCSVIRADQASVWLGQLSRGRPRSGCSQKARGRPRVKLLHVPAASPSSPSERERGRHGLQRGDSRSTSLRRCLLFAALPGPVLAWAGHQYRVRPSF